MINITLEENQNLICYIRQIKNRLYEVMKMTSYQAIQSNLVDVLDTLWLLECNLIDREEEF